MSLDWSPKDRASLEQSFRRYATESNKCADAARETLPVALVRDGAAAARVLRSEGAYVLPKPGAGPPWFYHHVAVLTREHDLDAFTGPDGEPDETYLERYWQYPEALSWEPIDIMNEEPR